MSLPVSPAAATVRPFLDSGERVSDTSEVALARAPKVWVHYARAFTFLCSQIYVEPTGPLKKTAAAARPTLRNESEDHLRSSSDLRRS